jgi:hypothetical protein
MANAAESIYSKHLKLILSLTLVAMVLLVFVQTSGHEFVNFDDNTYITANPNLKTGLTFDNVRWAFSTGYEGNWHPLTWLSHLLDYELYGLVPTGHHLANVTLHAFNSLLLFLVLTKLTSAIYRSFFVAALFAIHPLHVESVAWAAERKDLLCAFFWLVSIHLYVRYREQPLMKRYLLLSIAFVAGLMCKPMIVTLPFTLLLIDYWPLRRDAESTLPSKTVWASTYLPEKVPLLFLAVVSCVITFRVQENAGSVNPLDLRHLFLNGGNAALSYVKYMMKMFCPSRLAVFYPFVEETITITNVIFSVGLIVTITTLAVAYRRRFPYLISGWLWYLVTLIPVIGILRIGRHAIADRYTYMPLIGLFVLVVWGLSDLFTSLGLRTKYIAMFAITVITVLMFTSFRQVGYWRNSSDLFRHAVEVTENNCLSQNNLGDALISEGKYDEAYPHIIESLRIKPDFEVAYNNLGIINCYRGKFDAARAAFQASIKLKPSYAMPKYNLAVMYSNLGKRTLAMQEHAELAKIAPELAVRLKQFLDK